MGLKYEAYISKNPKSVKKFLDNDVTRKYKPFEKVSFNRKGK